MPNIARDPYCSFRQISHLHYKTIQVQLPTIHIYIVSLHVATSYLQCQFPSIGRINDDGRFVPFLFCVPLAVHWMGVIGIGREVARTML